MHLIQMKNIFSYCCTSLQWRTWGLLELVTAHSPDLATVPRDVSGASFCFSRSAYIAVLLHVPATNLFCFRRPAGKRGPLKVRR